MTRSGPSSATDTASVARSPRVGAWVAGGWLWASSVALADPVATAELDAELAALVDLYQGVYLSEPAEGVRGDRPILMRVMAVDPPPGRRYALYMELRHDGEQGEVYRQRLLVFDESPGRTGNSMTALGLANPQAAQALAHNPRLVAEGRLDTVAVLGEGCEMRFTRAGDGFLGRIDPADCVITGKSGQQRRIEGETLLGARAIEQLERGYDLEMQLLFGNADGKRYVWPRVARATPAP